MSKKIVLFDMDGTLIDSSVDITASVNYVRENFYNIAPLSIKEVVDAINTPYLNLAYEFYGRDVYDSDAKAMFEEHYDSGCIKNISLYDGILELLDKLKDGGVLMSVATNAPTAFAKKMTSHLQIDNYFDKIIGADMVKNPKPHPDMLKLLLDNYGYAPDSDKAWMVGDNIKDMHSARNAKIESIFVSWGFAEVDDYDYLSSHALELIDIIL